MGRGVSSKQLAVRWQFVVALVVVLLLACMLASVLVLPQYLVDRSLRGGALETKERVKAENDVRTTLLQAVAGLLLLAGAIATWRQLQVSRGQLQLNERTTGEQLKATLQELQLSREGQLTERFTRAIDQLGHEKLEVRLGAIYALERIARDSERDHWPIMEVLTAYARQHAAWKEEPQAQPEEPQEQPLQTEHGRKPPADIQAILTVLGRRTRTFRKGEDQRLDLRSVDLRHADLRRAHLEGALLGEAHLEDADLRGAHLEGADLHEAHLKRASLREADLEGAFLFEAHLERAALSGARLEDADLTRVNGLTKQQIESAITDKKTKLPNYLAPPPTS